MTLHDWRMAGTQKGSAQPHTCSYWKEQPDLRGPKAYFLNFCILQKDSALNELEKTPTKKPSRISMSSFQGTHSKGSAYRVFALAGRYKSFFKTIKAGARWNQYKCNTFQAKNKREQAQCARSAWPVRKQHANNAQGRVSRFFVARVHILRNFATQAS